MKTKFESIHFLGVLIIVGLMTFATEGRASQSAAPTETDTAVTSDQGQNLGPEYGRQFRRVSSRKDKQTFYLGVCAGQVLAQQGINFSDIAAGTVSGTKEDLRAATRAAIASCRQQMRSGQNGGTSATPSPTPDPSSTPDPNSPPVVSPTTSPTPAATTTTASET